MKLISKADYFNALDKTSSSLLNNEIKGYADIYWEEAIELSINVWQRLPGIGFLSVAKRLNSFFVACEIYQGKIDNDFIDYDLAFLSISILKLSNRQFCTAMEMFETQVQLGKLHRRQIMEYNSYEFVIFLAKQINPYF